MLAYLVEDDDGSLSLSIRLFPEGSDVRLDLANPSGDGRQLSLSQGLGAGASPAWSPKGDVLAFLARSASATFNRNGGDSHVVAPPQGDRLWTIDVRTGVITCLSQDLHVWEFTWGPDDIVALVSEEPTMPSWLDSRLVTIRQGPHLIDDLFDPTPEKFMNGRGNEFEFAPTVCRPSVSKDGRFVAFIMAATEEPGIVGGDLYVLDRSIGQVHNLTEGRPVSVSWVAWGPIDDIYAALWKSGQQALARITLDGEVKIAWQGEAALADRYQPRFSMSDDGTALVVREDRRRPREVFRVDGLVDDRAQWTQLTHLQPDIHDLDLADFETVTWEGRDGLPIEGHLLLPPGARVDGGLPLVVYPHGGPSFLHQHLFHGWFEGPYGTPFELFPANGFAVLLPNFRGSIGWGREFADLKVGDFGGEEIHDVIRGVEALVDRGVADPARVGIAGWSMAGYQAAWATCISQTFKAAVVGTAVADWRSLPLQANPVPLLLPLFGVSDPYEPDGLHDERALVRSCQQTNAAWLIVHTGQDPWIPPNHAYALFHALRQTGKSVEFVLYADENHSIRTRDNQVDVSKRVIEFFRQSLG
jgi:dipeptidyl aminopeptidase/acylaminoacyl peptidase